MKKYFLVLCFVISFQLAPIAHAQSQDDMLRVSLLEQINYLLKQIETLQKLVAERQQSVLFDSVILPSSAVIEQRYRVYNPTDFSWVSESKQSDLMERFIELSPNQFDDNFDEFVFFGAKEDFDAFVETLGNIESWRVGFSTELTTFPILSEQTSELLIHEIGHVVSYQQYDGESFLHLFEDEFWGNRKKRYGFVSEYAKESVEEDFAESFATFVLSGGQYRGIAAEKVYFFSRYPTLKNYRAEIRSNL